MTDAELAEEKRLAHDRAKAAEVGSSKQAYHATSSLTVRAGLGRCRYPAGLGRVPHLAERGEVLQLIIAQPGPRCDAQCGPCIELTEPCNA